MIEYVRTLGHSPAVRICRSASWAPVRLPARAHEIDPDGADDLLAKLLLST